MIHFRQLLSNYRRYAANLNMKGISFFTHPVECLHTRDHQPFVVAKTIDYFSITKKLNSQEINILLQHGRHFIVQLLQHGCHDVMCKHTIHFLRMYNSRTSSYNSRASTAEFSILIHIRNVCISYALTCMVMDQ